MFTGIVVDTGTVTEATEGPVRTIGVAPSARHDGIGAGSSIACAGICLTATSVTEAGFAVDLSPETLARTTAGSWQAGTRLNLEYALRAGDPLDGHIVTGHVDAVAEVVDVASARDSVTVRITMPPAIANLVAPKGSIAVDGTSLTVNSVDNDTFSVMLIPYTCRVTTLGSLQPGTAVNLEADIFARYVARACGGGGVGAAQ